MIHDYLQCQDCENFECFCKHLQNAKIDPESSKCRYGDKFMVKIERLADVRKQPKPKGTKK